MLSADVEVIEALRSLAAAYAAGVDRRDADLVGSCFTTDAQLIVRGRDGVRALPERRLDGRDAIAGIAQTIARYERTFHLLGQSRYEVSAARATGELYCEAHHHSIDGAGCVTDRVLYIRYEDEYVADEHGGWLIASRVVGVDWALDVPLGSLGEVPPEPLAQDTSR